MITHTLNSPQKRFTLKTALASVLICLGSLGLFAQIPESQIKGDEVLKTKDIVFHQIDAHTWVGSGNVMYNESVYVLEGNNKTLVIDMGTKIANLDKLVAFLTKKPLIVVATHVHPDHVGAIDSFPEVWINKADTVLIPQFMPQYKGAIKYLTDGQIIDLGGRQIEVAFTPAHTPGSTTFIDKAAAYGFSGDSFGSGNLLLTGDFSTLLNSCQKMSALMTKYNLSLLYPGHYFGTNPETKQRLDDMTTICKDVLAGKLAGKTNPNPQMGLDKIITLYGVNINYNDKSLK